VISVLKLRRPALLALVAAGAWAVRAERREKGHAEHDSARRAAEDALRDSERRHRLVLQHLPGASVALFDLDLRCLLLEGAHLQTAGIDGAAMVGRHVSEIVPADLLAATEPILASALAGQEGRVETFGPISRRTIVVQSAPVRAQDGTIEGIVFISRDVTEQRLAERAGREAERRFEIAFDRAPIGMALVGVDGGVERVNAALAGITGCSAEELSALRHEELLHPDDEDLAAEAFASLLAEDGMATELRIVHADGHPVWVALRATVVRDDDGAPVHVLLQVQDITERRSLEDQLRHLADHDALTGLLNRRGIDRALAQHVARGRRYGAQGALLVLDLDGFKAVNDSLGHAAGDELIMTCARVLEDQLRETDLLARLGGDEFAVLLPAEGEQEALTVAGKIVALIRAVGGVTVSVGVTPFGDEPTPTSALDRADMAMYAAKQAGGDRFEFTPCPLPATA
jgi:diguanylate cyclase (GGDEF)-like protein/PAS domain S-box-containing protein